MTPSRREIVDAHLFVTPPARHVGGIGAAVGKPEMDVVKVAALVPVTYEMLADRVELP